MKKLRRTAYRQSGKKMAVKPHFVQKDKNISILDRLTFLFQTDSLRLCY